MRLLPYEINPFIQWADDELGKTLITRGKIEHDRRTCVLFGLSLGDVKPPLSLGEMTLWAKHRELPASTVKEFRAYEKAKLL